MIKNVKLLKKEGIANGTMAFHFEKPENFEFTAGQFCDFTLINPPETDEEGTTRAFSLVQAPNEQELVIATRMRDTAFKRVLKGLPLGTEVTLDGPHGDFRLHKNETKPAVFLIGGIGITPVHSIITQAMHDHVPHNITLLYSNKTSSDATFVQDFEKLAEHNKNFTFIPVYTDTTEQGVEHGYIDANMLKRHVPDISSPIYYLSGPAAMVQAMRKMIVEIGADEDNIRTEEFSGY